MCLQPSQYFHNILVEMRKKCLRDCQAGGQDGNESRDVVNGDMKLVGVRVKDTEEKVRWRKVEKRTAQRRKKKEILKEAASRNYNIVLMIPECLK